MGLPDGEVSLREVVGWAQEQSVFLRSPGVRLVLWYLCHNAFLRDDNPEGRPVGSVLSAKASVPKIQRGTGLSNSTVREALQELQDNGYIYAALSPGRGRSRITIYWGEGADERRADFREGIRPLPKAFQRGPQKTEKSQEKPRDAVILPFPSR